MPEGVEVDVEDGVATVVFPDLATRGPLLGGLIAAVGPENVQKVTRPRVGYRVPESVARAAGVLDEAVDAPSVDEGKPDKDWSRAALNAYAEKAGVESPEKLGNKQDVLDAIAAKEAAPPADETPADATPPADETPGDETPADETK